MIAFAYYGGKNGLLPNLLPLLPAADHYCEPFAGSATVRLNRTPSKIETLNDINGDIVNFFQVLRDHGPELQRRLELTPYARLEFTNAWEENEDPIERARRFYIRVQMDVAKAGAKKDRSWSCNVTYVHNAHSYAVKNFYKKVEGMYEVAARLRNVQIDCRPAIDCIKKMDSSGTLFYCDPPYVPEARKSSNDYKFEMTVSDHHALAEVLTSCAGRVALSGYDSDLYAALYPSWFKTLFKSRRVPMSRGGLVRQECLWTNYDPFLYGRQSNLFQETNYQNGRHLDPLKSHIPVEK